MRNGQAAASMAWEKIPVDCYSGHKASERPLAFIFQGRRREISEILDRWYEGGMMPDAPVIDYFKVITDDRTVFILRYNAQSDEWSVRPHLPVASRRPG